ncbi:GPI biosynthesis protein Pig-F [Sphaerosporella brunnea]|uniref:GPI biosynthesis protein Pig-F n=1 Tax=Sphaerosporella brunnea TaxID=1250544 RepID=A0A5J5F6I8_9PEZI|nr:GPI biosynthesis protein Pig-F [Sphaerosporella brunnea]
MSLSSPSTHLHTFFLLGALAASFPPLIRSPASTLLNTLAPLALLQSLHLLLHATPVIAPSPPKKKSTPTGPSARRKEKPPPTTSATLITLLLSLLLSLTLGTTVFYALLILFGAPATTHVVETVATAAHVALLAVLPLVYAIGVDGMKWRDVVALRGDVEEAFLGALGACLGAWLGAVPIPLDWDREWQKWPITIIAGAYAGYLLGKTAGWFWKGKKMPF